MQLSSFHVSDSVSLEFESEIGHMYILNLVTEWLVRAPPPCEHRSLHDPSDRRPHLRSQRRPQAHNREDPLHRSLAQADSALFEVFHKSLHALKLGRELRQVIFERVELPVELPHGVRQRPDPGKETCDSHAKPGL